MNTQPFATVTTICPRCGEYLSPGTSHAGTCPPRYPTKWTNPPIQSSPGELRIAGALERIAAALEKLVEAQA